MMIAVSKDISADRFQDSRTSPYERLLLGRPRRLAVKGVDGGRNARDSGDGAHFPVRGRNLICP